MYTLHDLIGSQSDKALAQAGLANLKEAFSRFTSNSQQLPLVYDTVWGGIVSTATYLDRTNFQLDFGNTIYNDHHFQLVFPFTP